MNLSLQGGIRKLGHGRGKYYDRYLVLLQGGRLKYYHDKPKPNEEPRRTFLLNKNTVSFILFLIFLFCIKKIK